MEEMKVLYLIITILLQMNCDNRFDTSSMLLIEFKFSNCLLWNTRYIL